MQDILNDSVFFSNELFKNVIKQIDESCAMASIDPNVADRLKRPKRALVVSVPVRMDDGSIHVFEG
ncbi:hypothetical protein ACI39V_27455, partial [Klebsiella pneumoniae]